MFKNKKNIVGIIMLLVLMSVTITGCGNQDSTPEPSVTEQQNPATAPTEETISRTDTANSSSLIMYSSPYHPFASYVPDFHAFITNGAEVTNESNTEIW